MLRDVRSVQERPGVGIKTKGQRNSKSYLGSIDPNNPIKYTGLVSTTHHQISEGHDTMNESTTPQIAQIDPASVIIGTNVRLDARLDKDFIASIRERGVLEPVVVTKDEEGRYLLRYGQRRTLAAVEVGQATIPAYIVESTADADRIIDQLAENDHRAGINVGERVAALATLAGLGMTAAQIAKQTATRKADVETALVVAASPMASKATNRFHFLTLDQAATIAEFETDGEAVKGLTVAAKEGQFDHVAQRLRDDRDRQSRLDEAHSALKAEGTAVIEAWDPYGTYKKAAALTELLAPDGESRTSLTSDQHQQCPGHAAYVKASWQWDDEGNRLAVANVAYVCTDWKQNGHTQRYGSSSSTPSRDEMTDEQRDKARAQRRDVIESNKAWEASEPVRLAFLATFAARKTAPKGSAAFLARALTEHADVVGDVGGAALAAEWFKVSHPGYGGRLGAQAIIEKATEGRALLIAVCRVLADMEKHTSRESWRHVDPATSTLLKFLADNGYELADVEKRAAGLPRRAKRTAAA